MDDYDMQMCDQKYGKPDWLNETRKVEGSYGCPSRTAGVLGHGGATNSERRNDTATGSELAPQSSRGVPATSQAVPCSLKGLDTSLIPKYESA
jgi:hypothetical protein